MPLTDPVGLSLLPMVRVQSVLDRGFRRLFGLSRGMQDDLGSRFGVKLELRDFSRFEMESVLFRWAAQYYVTMARTMFEVLRILEPADFAGGLGGNIYFWPGYHSYFLNRRLFYRLEPSGLPQGRFGDLGVGLFGDPIGAPDLVTAYHYCSQERWFHYATMPPRQDGFRPASPYHWFTAQQPSVPSDPDDPIASVTFSTDASIQEDKSFPQHAVLNLPDPGNSRNWGKMVADKFNSFRNLNPDWEFPDRRDRETLDGFDRQRERDLREIRLLLISLWMHSVFRSEPPVWLEDLTGLMRGKKLTDMLDQISDATNDTMACDWGDRSLGRPGFKWWATIGLHPLVSEPPAPVVGPEQPFWWGRGTSAVYRRNIGWATILSSAPLKLPFISVVRPWIRTAYATLRNAEISLLLRNREPLERSAQAVRFLTHDIHKFVEESLGTLQREAGKCTGPVVTYRRIVLRTLEALSILAYTACTAVTDPQKLDDVRNAFRGPLLVSSDLLLRALRRVASDVRDSKARAGGARVHIPEDPCPAGFEVDPQTYASCLLLVGEIIRNYCKHGPPGKEAEWSAHLDGARLIVRLEGPSDSLRLGQTFGLLSHFLHVLDLGGTKPTWSDGYGRWEVIVNLAQ